MKTQFHFPSNDLSSNSQNCLIVHKLCKMSLCFFALTLLQYLKRALFMKKQVETVCLFFDLGYFIYLYTQWVWILEPCSSWYFCNAISIVCIKLGYDYSEKIWVKFKKKKSGSWEKVSKWQNLVKNVCFFAFCQKLLYVFFSKSKVIHVW